MAELKQVTITKTVSVHDAETLVAWLNVELHAYGISGINGHKDIGAEAVRLIQEAGFEIKSPKTPRQPKDTPISGGYL